MNIPQETIDQLIERFNQGIATPEEEALIEQCIEEGLIELEVLQDLSNLSKHLEAMSYLQSENVLRENFQELLAQESAKAEKSPEAFVVRLFQKRWVSSPVLQAAIVVLALLAGFGGGYWLRPSANEPREDIAQVKDELKSMKEMMMLTLLEKPSIHDRLKAVKISEEFDDASDEVTEALLKTLNNDKNVNVRLAALEALYQYAGYPQVREGLIRSIQNQNSPLVQLALAEIMAALQEKRSVKEFEQLIKSGRAPEEVKQQIKSSIQILM
ncbi:MAG: HEAT repeat domain-containing protein [Saprospiraceae bacterium]|nr:HEAT repeat domain-containing protein [Saprospiraceae bacterium]